MKRQWPLEIHYFSQSHLSTTPHLSLLLLNRSSTEAELEPELAGALHLLTYLLMSEQLSENFSQVRVYSNFQSHPRRAGAHLSFHAELGPI